MTSLPMFWPICRPARQGNLRCGNIILLHDGGGDRSQTVEALGMILDGLKERGYQVVPVSELMGKTPRRRDAAASRPMSAGRPGSTA